MKMIKAFLAVLTMCIPYMPGYADEMVNNVSRKIQQSKVRWDILSGYWAYDDGKNVVFISREGMVEAYHSTNQNNNKVYISFFAGQWRTVHRIPPIKPPDLEHVVMVTTEHFCGHYGQDASLDGNYFHYRDVVAFSDHDGQLHLESGYSTDINPPPDPLIADLKKMWRQYHANASTSWFKTPPPWHQITKDQVPQWFNEIMSNDPIHDNRCAR